MICKVCGSEFNIENFDVCPYCLTPVILESEDVIESKEAKEETESVDNNENIEVENAESEVADDPETEEDDYVVTEEDLIEEIEEESVDEEEVLIDEIGLSVRAVNAFRRAKIYTLNELIEFLAVNSVSDLRNVGAKTVKETEELIEKLRTGELEIIRSKTIDNVVSEGPIFGNISSDLDYLSIDALIELGLSKKLVSNFLQNNIKCCEELRCLSKKDLSNIIGSRYIDRLPAVASLLENDIISLLDYVLEKNRGSREYNIFLRRAKGETLQEIADNPGSEDEGVITRERVRQIERNYSRSVMPFVRELFYILKGGNAYVTVQDIVDIYDDDEYDQILLAACKSFEEFEYLDFAELFVEKEEGVSAEQVLKNLVTEIIGDGADIFECRELIEEVLTENKFDYIDIEAVVSLLKKYNYTIYGSFAVKGRSNYATVCMYLIRKLFPNGIKLSQSESEQSEDLIKLRQVIDDKYSGLSVPSSDRALSSTLVRSGLILRGRGMYISQEFILIDESLLQEIKSYIDAKETNKVFYNEIYSDFEGVLNMLCGVDNYNYLHGILAMRFPDSYEYGRDYLLKNGVNDSEADSIADRIYNYICNVGRPVSKAELVQAFRGFSNIMLIMPFVNDDRLMQWDYNYYACTRILDISHENIANIEETILEIFDENSGYASDGLLYEKVQENNPEFLQKNNINSEMNLHYIVSKLYYSKMDFRRPHIGRKNVIDLSSTKNVILYLLGNPDFFTYDQYLEMCDKMKWSRVTVSAVLYDIEEDYARVSMDGYIRKELFSISDNLISDIKLNIERKSEEGILSLMNLEMDGFPEWNHEWNEFVIETVVKKYYPDLLVVHPSMKNRRYQRGIIVKKELGLYSYPEIVAYKMKLTGSEMMTESQFLSFLVVHNLARKVIPNELTNSDYVKKEGEYYITVK